MKTHESCNVHTTGFFNFAMSLNDSIPWFTQCKCVTSGAKSRMAFLVAPLLSHALPQWGLRRFLHANVGNASNKERRDAH